MSAVTVVLYHNIAEEETLFEAGIRVTTKPATFEKHLEFYQKNYDIIDLSTLLSGRLPKRPLLITFDDCYRSVLSAVRTYMAPRSMPSLFFVNPSLVDGGISIDNLIVRAVNVYGIETVCRALGVAPTENSTAAALIANLLSRCTARQRFEIIGKLHEAFPISAAEMAMRSPMLEAFDFPELRELGVEIGNHTANHVHCGALDPEEYADELVAAQADLERLSGGPVRSFSVAYGDERDLPTPVLKTLRESGHEAIFLVHARSNMIRKAPDIWYRVSFRDEDVSKLPTRLGVLPLLRTAKSLLTA